jgi:hypothetical protein
LQSLEPENVGEVKIVARHSLAIDAEKLGTAQERYRGSA